MWCVLHDAASPGCEYAKRNRFNTAYPFKRRKINNSHSRSRSVPTTAAAAAAAAALGLSRLVVLLVTVLSNSRSQINPAHLSKSSGGAQCLSQSLQSYSAIPAVPRKLPGGPPCPLAPDQHIGPRHESNPQENKTARRYCGRDRLN